MKLLIIRHADPDYAVDSLTPAGWREAALLADRLENTAITKIYCSPWGGRRILRRLPYSARVWRRRSWTGFGSSHRA